MSLYGYEPSVYAPHGNDFHKTAAFRVDLIHVESPSRFAVVRTGENRAKWDQMTGGGTGGSAPMEPERIRRFDFGLADFEGNPFRVKILAVNQDKKQVELQCSLDANHR